MLIILSPAKTFQKAAIEESIKKQLPKPTKPKFMQGIEELIPILNQMQNSDLKKLMKLSDKLTELNKSRYAILLNKSFSQSENNTTLPELLLPAIIAFKGDVYREINLNDFKKTHFENAQKRIRIISGLFGLLRPMDRIYPYRLEMGTRIKNNRGKNLYEFWGEKLTTQIDADINKLKTSEKVLLNLASNEYSSAIDFEKINHRIINISFKERRQDGTLKVIGIHSKKARGSFANWIIQNDIKKTSELTEFDEKGYKFNKKESNSAGRIQNLVFSRD